MFKHLYDIFAQKWYHGGSVLIYSDPHFNDPESKLFRKNYIGDDEQVKKINSKIGKNDTLIILGDIGDIEFVKKLRGYKVLIMGNHDQGASKYKRNLVEETISTWIDGQLREFTNMVPDDEDNHLFDEVYEGPLMINDKVILSHEPITPLPPYLFNIYGHDHAGAFISKQHLNVCAEIIDYTPINLINLIKNGLLKDIESIHRITINNAVIRKNKKLKA